MSCPEERVLVPSTSCQALHIPLGPLRGRDGIAPGLSLTCTCAYLSSLLLHFSVRSVCRASGGTRGWEALPSPDFWGRRRPREPGCSMQSGQVWVLREVLKEACAQLSLAWLRRTVVGCPCEVLAASGHTLWFCLPGSTQHPRADSHWLGLCHLPMWQLTLGIRRSHPPPGSWASPPVRSPASLAPTRT